MVNMKSGLIAVLEFYYRCVFRLMLAIIGWRIAKRAPHNEKLQALLEREGGVIQFQTADYKAVRHFDFGQKKVKVKGGRHSSPSLTVGFVSAKSAVQTLMKGDMNTFLAAIQNKSIKVSGEYGLLMWFMSLVKQALK